MLFQGIEIYATFVLQGIALISVGKRQITFHKLLVREITYMGSWPQ